MSSSESCRRRSQAADAVVGVSVPGFVDPHLHLLALAADRLSVDLGGASDPEAILARLRDAEVPAGGWLRGSGYEAHRLPGGLAPNRDQLDSACPDRPLVIHERAGHQAVLNSRALALLGLDSGAAPPGLEIVAGRPTGRVHDAERLLAAVPPLERQRLAAAVAAASRDLAAAGLTAITDATHTNDLGDLEFLAELKRAGLIRQRLEAMVGIEALDGVAAAGLAHAADADGVVIGHAKAIAELLGPDGLREAVAAAHAGGYPVAVHVLDVEPLEWALDAFAASPPPPGCRDRIEHLALSLPAQVERAAALGVAIVTQPSFLVERGAKYRAELSAPELEMLYRLASPLRAGALVAISSDAPVAAADPLAAIAAATSRGGFGEAAEAVPAETALRLVSSAAAAVGSRPARHAGDRVLLDRDPRLADGAGGRVLATFAAATQIYPDRAEDVLAA